MIRNQAGQTIGAQMLARADFTEFSGSVTVYVKGDSGSQALGANGSGVCVNEGHGYYSYTPTQAETDYAHVAFTFVGSGAITFTVQVAPGADLSADVSALSAAVAAIAAKTTKLTFDAGNFLAANVKKINDTALTGDGTADDPWGPD
jgi:hypothetical protein